MHCWLFSPCRSGDAQDTADLLSSPGLWIQRPAKVFSFHSASAIDWVHVSEEVFAAGVLQSDSARQAQLRSHTAEEGHLYQKFTWGNYKSLVADPAEAGIDVRKRLLAFYR